MAEDPLPPSDVMSRRAAVAELGEAMREALAAVCESEASVEDLQAATMLAWQIAPHVSKSVRPFHQLASVDDLESGIRYFGPVSGLGNPMSPPIDFSTTPDGVLGRVTLGRRFEGPPGHVHGGVSSLLMDETLGQAITRAGRWGLTAFLNMTYRRAVPLGVELYVEAAITERDGRKTMVEGGISLASDPGVQYVGAKALFITPREETHAEYFNGFVDASGDRTSVRLGGQHGW